MKKLLLGLLLWLVPGIALAQVCPNNYPQYLVINDINSAISANGRGAITAAILNPLLQEILCSNTAGANYPGPSTLGGLYSNGASLGYFATNVNTNGTLGYAQALVPSNNLSDVANPATALANLYGTSTIPANRFLASPSAGPGVPSFRALTAADFAGVTLSFGTVTSNSLAIGSNSVNGALSLGGMAGAKISEALQINGTTIWTLGVDGSSSNKFFVYNPVTAKTDISIDPGTDVISFPQLTTPGYVYAGAGGALSTKVIGTTSTSNNTSGTTLSTSGTAQDVTTLTLAAGTWDISAQVYISGSSSVTACTSDISLTAASTTPLVAFKQSAATSSNTVCALTLPREIVTIGSSTTYHLVASGTWSAGTVTAYGGISARSIP